LVCFAWIFFRAPTASDAMDVIRAIARLDLTADVDKVGLVPIMALAILGLDIVSRLRHTRGWRPEKRVVLAGAGTGLAVAMLLVFSGREPVPFVYFQF
jgi:glucokinase